MSAVGSMQGASTTDLRALAKQMEGGAVRLDAVRTQVRSRLYTCGWSGRDAQEFQRLWESRLQPLLSANAAYLRASSQRLLSEAQQQELASRADGALSPYSGIGRAVEDAARRLGRVPDLTWWERNLPWARFAVGAGWDVVSGLGTAQDVLTVGSAALWMARSPLAWKTLLNSDAGDLVRAFGRSGGGPQLLPKALGPALGVVNVGFSGYEAYRAFESGDANKGVRAVISVGLGIASVVPVTAPVAIPLSVAWTVGNIAYDANRETVDRFVSNAAGRAVDYVVRNPEVLIPPPVRVGVEVTKAAWSLVDNPDDPLRRFAGKLF